MSESKEYFWKIYKYNNNKGILHATTICKLQNYLRFIDHFKTTVSWEFILYDLFMAQLCYI